MPNHQLNVPSPSSHLPVLSTFLTDVCNPTIIRYSETSGVVLASSVQSKGGEGVVERNDVVAGFSQKVTRAVTTQLQTFLCILTGEDGKLIYDVGFTVEMSISFM